MPERRPDGVLGHHLSEAPQGLREGRQRAAFRRREPAIERCGPWAKGCLWAWAEPAAGQKRYKKLRPSACSRPSEL